MRYWRITLWIITWAAACASWGQELTARIDVNTQKIQGTNKNVFEDLQHSLTQFMNERRWTNQQYGEKERIKCTFSIVVNKYNESSGMFTCEAYVQSVRPVYGATYETVAFSTHDKNFNFEYHEFDQLEFRDDQVDQSLTALMAYYAYLIIGVDLDTFAPQGGTEVLQKALDVCRNAEHFNTKGWKAFEDNSNRFAIINDYMDGVMEPLRALQYDYHRKGLDQLSRNADAGRKAVTEALPKLREAYANKSISAWPRLFAEYKRDELVGLYAGKDTKAEKQPIYDMLTKIDASQSSYWKKLLE